MDLGKGIDDVCLNHGPDKVLEILANEIEIENPLERDLWKPDPSWGEPDRDAYEAHQKQTEEEWQNLQAEARQKKAEEFPLPKWNPESLEKIAVVQSHPDFNQEER